MTFTADELLDLTDSRRRVESFRFELLDSSHGVKGTLAVDPRNPPTMRNDVTAPVPRTLAGLRILPRTLRDAGSTRFFAQDVDTVTDRVRVVHVFGIGTVRFEKEWGIFLFSDDDSEKKSGGDPKDCELGDQTQITSQLLSQSVSYPAGTNVSTALNAEADAAGLISRSVESSTVTLSAPIVGLAGRDSHDKVMGDLATVGGLLRPYFDNSGAWVVRSAPVLANATADHDYTRRRIRGSIHESNGLRRAPNVYVVRDTSLSDAELVGRFYVPESAPNSVARIGFERPVEIDVQGLYDQPTADAAAAAQYAQDSAVFASMTFESTLDSRHDSFDVVAVGDELWLEQEWTAVCVPKGTMGHDIRRIYT